MVNITKQTNRTMLMETLNSEKMDLLTLAGDVRGMESLSDDKIREINEHLMVQSFDEVLEKLSPTVYCYFSANNQRVSYRLDKPEGAPGEIITEIPLNRQNEFMNMLMSMVDMKRSEGRINMNLKFEKTMDTISPKKVMDDIHQNRKEFQYTYGEYAKLDDGDLHKKDLADRLNVMLEETSANYNNVTATFPSVIEDTKTRLLLGDGSEEKDSIPLALGVLSMGETGELRILGAPKAETTALVTVGDNVNAGLIAALKEGHEAFNEGSSDYVTSLVARMFCPLTSNAESQIDKEREVANYNEYLEFYKEFKDEFIKTVKSLMKKLLGIWCLPEQYPREAKGMKPSLLITNMENELMAKPSNISRLITYLSTVNVKNDSSNTVWYATVPSVSLDQSLKMELTRGRFKGNTVSVKTDIDSVESLECLMDALKDYAAQCFFSYETNDSTIFNALATGGIEKYEDRCVPLMGKPSNEYAILCLPNFTIIPKDKSGVVLDRHMVIHDGVVELPGEKEGIMKIWIDGVYVGVVYVTAGITAACQYPEYPRDKFGSRFRIDPELPGVCYDTEADDHALVTYTSMAKETMGFTNSIKTDINRKNSGFVFFPENVALNGTDITNIMVYKARNLMSDGYTFEPIYKTQVTTYTGRVMRHGTGGSKEDAIVSFFSNNPNSQKNQRLAKRECLNAILGNGDDTEYTIDKEPGFCTLNITPNGNVKNLEVEINRLNAASGVQLCPDKTKKVRRKTYGIQIESYRRAGGDCL